MNYVVIGASAAGISAVKKLRELKPEADITMVSKDSEIYSRCILHHYLDDTRTLEEMNFAGLDFAERLGVRWERGHAVCAVDTSSQEVVLDDGRRIAYGELLIASGSHTNCPPIPGLREAKNAYGFRDLDDARRIRQKVEDWDRIFVMGAGLVGIDVVAGLLAHGKQITLADMGPYMLPIQLDEASAGNYQRLFSQRGVEQRYQTGARELVLDDSGFCTHVELTNGETIAIDAVINCAGVRPNVEFLEGSSIEVDRFGLVVDKHGRTNVEHVYGAGDVCGRSPIWPAAERQGMVAAYAMCGEPYCREDYFGHKSSMHFLGLSTTSIGRVNRLGGGCTEHVLQGGPSAYLKLVEEEGVLMGAIVQGDLAPSGVLSEAVRERWDYPKAARMASLHKTRQG